MNTPKHLVIMHYHLLKGGVTDVITRMVQALLSSPAHCPDVITIACGDVRNIDAIQRVVNNNRVSFVVEPALGYLEHIQATSTMTEHDICTALTTCFNAYAAPHTLWWVHNHHLGKNPLFTRTLIEYLHAHTIPCILHIHDFPEQARIKNLELIQQYMPMHTAYTVPPTTGVAVINSVDHAIMNDAKADTWLVPNIVPSALPQDTANTKHPQHTKQCTKEMLINIFPQYAPKNLHTTPLLFTYPVRCIRRKNVLEAGLITRMYEHKYKVPCLFCITLPGTSKAELGYSQCVESAFRTKAIKGFFGIGMAISDTYADTYTFEDVCTASDMIISSSTQEGFGFSYLGTTQWNVPLLARYIPVAQDIIPILDKAKWHTYWYHTLHIPMSCFGTNNHAPSLETIQRAYHDKIDAIASLYPQHIIASLHAECNQMFTADTIDFSFLPVKAQYHIISNFDVLAHKITDANTSLLEHTHTLITRPSPSPHASEQARFLIEKAFGRQSFLNAFERITTNIAQQTTSPIPQPKETAQNILQAHTQLSAFRLLYDTFVHT